MKDILNIFHKGSGLDLMSLNFENAASH